jgi:hypothetical protein
MPTPSGLLDEIACILHRFEGRATRVHVSFAAAIYRHQRPGKSAGEVAEVMTSIPWLPWPRGFGTIEERVNLMVNVVDQLDAQYWTATLEDDGIRRVGA